MAAALHAPGGARAHRARVCPAVSAADRDRRWRVRGAGGRHPARPVVQHGLRRQVGEGGGGRRARDQRPHAGRSRVDRALQLEYGSRAAIGRRSWTAPRGGRRSEAWSRCDAIRPGVEARREHPERVGHPAARGHPDQRFPAQRLAGRRGGPAAGRRRAHPGPDYRLGQDQPRDRPCVAGAVGVSESAADDRDDRRRQSHRRRRIERRDRPRARRACDSVAARQRRGSRVGFGHVRSGDRRRPQRPCDGAPGRRRPGER